MNRLKLLRPASFRGIRFEVDTSSKDGGRRVVTHKFPGNDAPYHEDMGKDVNVFSIDCWINGDNFISRAAALDAALEQKGPGTLIHPVLGEIEVIVLKYGRRDDTRAVGDVDYNITFERFGGPVFPSAIGNSAFTLGSRASNFLTSLSSDFESIFRATGIPDYITADSILRFGSHIDNLQSVLSTAGLQQYFLGELPSWIASASGLTQRITGLFDSLGGSSKKKSTPMIGGNMQPAATAPALPLSSALVKSSTFSAGSDSMTGTAIRVTNARALDNLFQAAALSAAAASSRHATYESREQAIAFRDHFSRRMEIVADSLANAGWEDSWSAGVQMNAALVMDINERVGRLPRTVAIETRAVRPSLEIANRLYGDDPERLFVNAEDIARRNRVIHPGLVPARKLEVLIDASSK